MNFHEYFADFDCVLGVSDDSGTYNDIRTTCPCDLYPLSPHFYIVKLGFTGVYNVFSFLLQNRLWVLVRTTRTASLTGVGAHAHKVAFLFSQENILAKFSI